MTLLILTCYNEFLIFMERYNPEEKRTTATEEMRKVRKFENILFNDRAMGSNLLQPKGD